MSKKKTKEKADYSGVASSSASGDEMFKEDIPKPIRLGGIMETQATEDDTLMGRLAKRMAARDHIDSLNLGTKE